MTYKQRIDYYKREAEIRAKFYRELLKTVVLTLVLIGLCWLGFFVVSNW